MPMLLSLHILAAKRGDGLHPDLVEALKRQAAAEGAATVPPCIPLSEDGRLLEALDQPPIQSQLSIVRALPPRVRPG